MAFDHTAHVLNSTLKADMPNTVDQQVLEDACLESLSAGATPDEILQRMKDIASQIHAVDPDGPSLPSGPIGIGDLFDFRVEVDSKWKPAHPGVKLDPWLTPA